jgi:A/G-specific adenine glycosylase
MVAEIRKALIRFYDMNARDLPWRRTRDPYAIWVSEVMLQQTRVETVLGYYERFLARFPTLRLLASASEDDVLSLWSGLGYYRRARLLYASAREAVVRHGGRVPREAHARQKLLGVGRYMSGAIGSIAFDKPEAAVDGNAGRVLCRVYAIDTPLGRADTEKQLWEKAEALVQGPRPGALNQALIELGATVCTKAVPGCGRCPLRSYCRALAQGRVHELPTARKRRPPRAVTMVAVAAFNANRDAVLLVRGETELFGGLWNLPMAEGSGAQSAKRLLDTHGAPNRLCHTPLCSIDHLLTHRHLHVELFTAHISSSSSKGPTRLVPLADLSTLGLSSLTVKALRAATKT